MALRELESDFQDVVAALAQLHRWRVAHFGAARTSRGWRTPVRYDGKGFPDLVLLRGEVILYRECKRDGEEPDDDQQAWGDALLAAGQDWAVWRPADWSKIERTLSP